MPEINLRKTMEKPSFWKLPVGAGGEIYTVFDEESDFQVENEQFRHPGAKNWKNQILKIHFFDKCPKNTLKFAPVQQKVSGWKRRFFRKPPAYHRLPFMPPFAGDIGAGPGSLKWIAQIPRKACRWALKGDSKKVFWAWMWDIFFVGELFLVSPQNTSS